MSRNILNSPRTRGGQPYEKCAKKAKKTFFPHARGSTFCRRTHETTQSILPARAGVNPYLFAFLVPDADSPRMRGGQPWAQSIQSRVLFSPHTRGSTPHPQSFRRGYRILPACAGVSLISVVGKAKILNSPRMRGGQPAFFMKKLAEAQFSPHVRGSNHETDTVNSDGMIHPACAGVNPPTDRLLCSYAHSPRMRGDQPR